MDCSNNQWGFQRRPQMPQPPCMNTDCCEDPGSGRLPDSWKSQPNIPLSTANLTPEPVQKTAEDAFAMHLDHDSGCDVRRGALMPRNPWEFGRQMPVGMGYVPWQRWNQIYPPDQALERGTIFPELDLPFTMGRCRR